MVPAVGADGQMGLAFQQAPLALDAEPSAVAAGSAAVGHQPVAFDVDGILALGLFHRNVGGHVGDVAQSVVAVPVGGGLPRSPESSS